MHRGARGGAGGTHEREQQLRWHLGANTRHERRKEVERDNVEVPDEVARAGSGPA